jgi:hypothetical protein
MLGIKLAKKIFKNHRFQNEALLKILWASLLSSNGNGLQNNLNGPYQLRMIALLQQWKGPQPGAAFDLYLMLYNLNFRNRPIENLPLKNVDSFLFVKNNLIGVR